MKVHKIMDMEEMPQILIIDNQLESCLLLEEIFSNLGIQSLCTSTLKEADNVLSAVRPSVVMISQDLPDGSGIKYIPEIRKRLPQSRIIATTVEYDSQTKLRAFNAGANMVLEKPFTFRQVCEAIIDYERTEKSSFTI